MLNQRKGISGMTTSPVISIMLKCLDCSRLNAELLKECTVSECPLHPFRMGKNPNRTGIGGRPPLVKAEKG